MTAIIIDQPELVFVEVWSDLNIVSTPTPDASVVEILTATEPVKVETVPASSYLEVVENALRGPPGPMGPPGGTSVDGWWDYSISTAEPPEEGQIRTAPAAPVVGEPMTIYLSAVDDDGLVWEGPGLTPGDEIQLRGTAGAVQTCTVIAYALTVPGPGGYATISTTLTSSSAPIYKNARVEVTLIRTKAGAAVITWPTGAEPSLAGVPDGTLWVEYTP